MVLRQPMVGKIRRFGLNLSHPILAAGAAGLLLFLFHLASPTSFPIFCLQCSDLWHFLSPVKFLSATFALPSA
ncbi:MAG: hypothetical protein ACRERD_02920, partial [Candidatus Binatia bacterium]